MKSPPHFRFNFVVKIFHYMIWGTLLLQNAQAQADCGALFQRVFSRPPSLQSSPTCCLAIKTSTSPPSILPGTDTDPYLAGGASEWTHSNPLTGFELVKPAEIGGGNLTFLGVQRVNRDSALMTRLLNTHRPLNQLTSPAGEGGLSLAHFYDPEAPAHAGQEWFRQNAHFVLKTRKFEGRTEKWLNLFLKRDLALRGLLEQFAAHVSLNGKPLLRIARDHTTPDQFRYGLQVQEAIHGPSVFELKTALYDLKYGLSHPKKTLLAAGFNPENPKELEELENSISALEAFYRGTHDDVLHFTQANSLPNIENTVVEKSQKVGFDFNHGTNVIWSQKERIWVAIDW